MKLLNKIALASVVALSICASAPAHATTSQDDVQACRVAMAERGDVNMDDYRLRFEYVKGNSQGRTVHLKVIPNRKQDSSFRVSCELNKNKVVALNSKNRFRFAQR